MAQPATSLLRFIWSDPDRQSTFLIAFAQWVNDGNSRREAVDRLKEMATMLVYEQAVDELSELDLEHVRWDQIMEFLFISEKRKRLRQPLLTVPSDELWTELTDENEGDHYHLIHSRTKRSKTRCLFLIFPWSRNCWHWVGGAWSIKGSMLWEIY